MHKQNRITGMIILGRVKVSKKHIHSLHIALRRAQIYEGLWEMIYRLYYVYRHMILHGIQSSIYLLFQGQSTVLAVSLFRVNIALGHFRNSDILFPQFPSVIGLRSDEA